MCCKNRMITNIWIDFSTYTLQRAISDPANVSTFYEIFYTRYFNIHIQEYVEKIEIAIRTYSFGRLLTYSFYLCVENFFSILFFAYAVYILAYTFRFNVVVFLRFIISSKEDK